jgi:hypothetical protein
MQPKIIVTAIALLCVFVAAAETNAATASWDRNSEPDIIGYKVSYGIAPGSHPMTIDVGNQTSHTFDLSPGQRYYIVVQAYNAAGDVSPESAEVWIDVPAAATTDVTVAPIPMDPRSPVSPVLTLAPSSTSEPTPETVTTTDVPEVPFSATEATASSADVSLSTAVTGDFDGDAIADLATFRPETGEWRVWSSSAKFAMSAPVVWGLAGDVAIPADYDGDGRTDFGIYRPSTGTWHVLFFSTSGQSRLDIQWGNSADRPVAFDYDRDGRADLALARARGFQILLSSSNYTEAVTIE